MAYNDDILADTPTMFCALDDVGARTAGTIDDLTANAYDGEEMNGSPAVFTGGLVGDGNNCDHYNSTGARIKAGVDLWDLAGSYTAECWCSTDTLPGTNNKVLLSSWVTGGRTFHISLTKAALGNVLRLSWWNGAQQDMPMADAMVVDDIYHVVASYSTTNGREFWVNGVLVASDPSTVHTDTTADRRCSWATWLNAYQAGTSWDGKIDKVAMYDTALSGTTIQSHYVSGGGTVAGMGGSPIWIPYYRHRRR